MRSPFILAVIALAVISVSTQSAQAQIRAGGADQVLFELANRERAAQGLPALKWNDALAQAARQHALRMAQQNALSHQLPGEAALPARVSNAGGHFSTIAENVAEGPDPDRINQQWMNSPPHRANLLDPELNSVGIAVADRNGTLFAVEDFSVAAGGMSISEQEKVVDAQLQMHGLHLLHYTEDARKSCPLDNGYAGNHTPSFVLHYAAPDLQTLPDLLVQRIKTDRYHSAVVGACPSDAKIGFSMYRVAVLLFE
jgi:hypothetical protein